MRLLLFSDTHFRGVNPVGRTDDIVETQKRKWNNIVDIAINNEVNVVLQAGDLFDNPNPSVSILNMFAGLLVDLHDNNIPFFTIAGQHDMLMRSPDLDRTAMGLFESFGVLDILGTWGVPFGDDIYLHGHSYFDDYKKLEPRKNKFNILVTHDMIGNEPLFPGHELTDAEKFLQTYKEFDIILCGDYHYPFKFKSKDGRYIVNTGCLLRLTRLEKDMNRNPFVYVVDTETDKWKKCYVGAEPTEKVFMNKLEDRHEMSKNLDEFITMLKTQNKVGLSYLENLEIYFKENETKEEVQYLIREVLK